MAAVKIKTRLLFLISSIIVVFILVFFLQRALEEKRLVFLLQNTVDEKKYLFDKIAELKNNSVRTLVYDYTYWDDMVVFVSNRDNQWAKANIDPALATFNTTAVWVYNISGECVYSVASLSSEGSLTFPLGKVPLSSLFGQDRLIHFFVNHTLGLMEVRGATIHPTLDSERTTEPKGYFFAVRLWDKEYVDELSKLIEGRISLLAPRDAFYPEQVIQKEKGMVMFYEQLLGWDGKPVQEVSVQSELKTLKNFRKVSYQTLVLLILFSLTSLAMVSFFVVHWITDPLQILSKALKSGESVYLEKIRKASAEFGVIATLAGNFIKQKNELNNAIADSVRREAELQKAYEQLKNTEAQLMQSSKMAAIGQLASGVAHEINNPLTGVLNNVQLIRMDLDSDRPYAPAAFKELLQTVEESALRCKDIVRSLLDFSHVSSGIFQAVSLNEIVHKVTALINHELRLQNIMIRKELQENLPSVMGDSQLLQQVIFNLLSNAKWAIQKKSVKEEGIITIATLYNEQMHTIELTIGDTGIGIPEEGLNHLFEPFFTTKPVGEGTGLGLAFVYKIIKDHNGQISVESSRGSGTVFKITLPFLQKV